MMLAFYLWGGSARHCLRADGSFPGQSVMHRYSVELLIALAGLSGLLPAILFWVRDIGGRYGERISGGQALGQKEYGACHLDGIYLSESAYPPWVRDRMCLWQNIINSCQLWKKRKNEIKY